LTRQDDRLNFPPAQQIDVGRRGRGFWPPPLRIHDFVLWPGYEPDPTHNVFRRGYGTSRHRLSLWGGRIGCLPAGARLTAGLTEL
jgi:hypothetical protein